jgi:hypothetical protein
MPRRKKLLLAKVAILEILELSVNAESSPARSEVRTRAVAKAPPRGGDVSTRSLGVLNLEVVGTSCGLLHDVNAQPCVEINNSRKDERRIGSCRFDFMIKNLCFRRRDNEVDVRAYVGMALQATMSTSSDVGWMMDPIGFWFVGRRHRSYVVCATPRLAIDHWIITN